MDSNNKPAGAGAKVCALSFVIGLGAVALVIGLLLTGWEQSTLNITVLKNPVVHTALGAGDGLTWLLWAVTGSAWIFISAGICFFGFESLKLRPGTGALISGLLSAACL